MAHFYGKLTSGIASSAALCSKGVTLNGTKKTGIQGHVTGWDLGIRVEIRHTENSGDIAYIYRYGGSNSPGLVEHLATVYENGDIVFNRDAGRKPELELANGETP